MGPTSTFIKNKYTVPPLKTFFLLKASLIKVTTRQARCGSLGGLLICTCPEQLRIRVISGSIAKLQSYQSHEKSYLNTLSTREQIRFITMDSTLAGNKSRNNRQQKHLFVFQAIFVSRMK